MKMILFLDRKKKYKEKISSILKFSFRLLNI